MRKLFSVAALFFMCATAQAQDMTTRAAFAGQVRDTDAITFLHGCDGSPPGLERYVYKLCVHVPSTQSIFLVAAATPEALFEQAVMVSACLETTEGQSNNQFIECVHAY